MEADDSKPLERSSYEFMVALIVASITQLIPNTWAYLLCWVVIAGVSVYFCWASRGTVGYGPWRKGFLSICCLVFLFSISYGQIKSRYQEEYVIPPGRVYLEAWGGLPGPKLVVSENPLHVVTGNAGGVVTVNGRSLDKYKKRFELMAVVLHVMNSESYTDKGNLCKSRLMKIRPEDIVIRVDFNEQFLKEIAMGAHSQRFVLLAMPKGLRPEDIDTLNDAEEKGAELIGAGDEEDRSD